MSDVDVHRIFDRVAHLYDTGWVQRALYSALQDGALAELRAWRPGLSSTWAVAPASPPTLADGGRRRGGGHEDRGITGG